MYRDDRLPTEKKEEKNPNEKEKFNSKKIIFHDIHKFLFRHNFF